MSAANPVNQVRRPGDGTPGPAQPPVPPGMRLRPDPDLNSMRGGTVLLGGFPYRLIRLSPGGGQMVSAWWQGTPVPDRPAARALARRLLDTGMAHPQPDAEGAPADNVTVVIPVRDRVAELTRCLAGTRGLRVIVVDDCSAEAAAVAGAAAAAGARCLRRERGGGPGAARNTGLAAVDTPFTAFLDSDCVPEPGWLAPLLPHFSDPAVAAVAPRIVSHERGKSWLARYEAIRSALDMGPDASIVRPGARVPYVPAAALVVRTEAARTRAARAGAARAGAARADAAPAEAFGAEAASTPAACTAFAEDMPVGEDVDFVWRLAAAGWHVRYEPTATVAHQHRVRLPEWFARRRDYGASAAPLELRHPGTVPAVGMSGWSAAAWLAAVAGRPLTGAGITVAATALLARRLAPFTDRPWGLAARLAGRGTAGAGRLLGSTLARTWWPLAIPSAMAVPRLRLPLAALLLAAPFLDWRDHGSGMDLGRYMAARLLDDLAYSIGVWQGCVQNRTAAPLRPRLWWWSATAEPGGPRPRPRSSRLPPES